MSTDRLRTPGGLPVTAGGPAHDLIVQQVLTMAVWAPSVHNTQPWWFSAGEQEICLYADSDRHLRVADPYGRQMLISCGAALFTVRLALRSLGYVPDTRVLPDPADPELVARITWQRRAAATDYEQHLAAQVPRRRTHRGGFEPVSVPDGLLAQLRSGAGRDGASLHIVDDEGRRAGVAAIVETAERVFRLDSLRVRELARWTVPPGSPRRDGVTPTGYPAHAERTDPLSRPGTSHTAAAGACRRSACLHISQPEPSAC